MAEIDKSALDALKQAVKSVEENSRKTEKSFGSMVGSAEKIARVLETKVGHSVGKLLGIKEGFNDIAHNFVQGMEGETKIIDAIKTRIDKTKIEATKLREIADKGTQLDFDKYKAAEAHLIMLERKAKSFEEVQKKIGDGMSKLFYAPLIVEAWRISLDYATKLNAALIDSDSSTFKIIASMEAIAKSQAITGASTEDTLAATKALIARGFQYRDGLAANLEIVEKFKEGLGVSEESSAELLAVYNNIKAPIQQAADGIARIRSETALSASEAVKYYTEIGRLVKVINPAGSKFASENAEYLAGLAGTYKELGGNAEDIMSLVKHLSSVEGVGVASMFGGGPGFTGNKGGAEKMLENLKTYSDKMLQSAGTNDIARASMIKAISEQTGASQDLIANLDNVLANYKNRKKSDTALDEQWNNQTKNLTDQLSRIRNSLHGMLQGGLIIPITVLSTLLRPVSALFTLVNKIPGAFIVLGSLIGIVVVGATWKLTRAMIALAASLKMAARNAGLTAMAEGRRAILEKEIDNGQMLLPGLEKSVTRRNWAGEAKSLMGKEVTKDGVLNILKSLPGYAMSALKWVRTAALGIVSLPALIVAGITAAIAAPIFGAIYWLYRNQKKDAEARLAKLGDNSKWKQNYTNDRAISDHIAKVIATRGVLSESALYGHLTDVAKNSTSVLQGSLDLQGNHKFLSGDQQKVAALAMAKKIIGAEYNKDSAALAVFDKTHKANLTPSEQKERQQILECLEHLRDSNEEANKLADLMVKTYESQTEVIERHHQEKLAEDTKNSMMNTQLNPLAGI